MLRTRSSDLARELVYAIRVIRRRPLLPLLAVLTLALGIGGGAASFTVVDGTLLRPMMVPEM